MNKELDRYLFNLPIFLTRGFRKTTKTSVRKDYGTDSQGRPYYIRYSPTKITVNGLDPIPQEMRNDWKEINFLMGKWK